MRSIDKRWNEQDYIQSMDRIRMKLKISMEYVPNEILNHDIKLIRATSEFRSDIGTSMAHDYEISKYASENIFVLNMKVIIKNI